MDSFSGEIKEGVSIRAPLRRAGRLLPESFTLTVLGFQSAPRSEERGDIDQQRLKLRIAVSIRAPLRRAGRQFASNANKAELLFQSAPRSEERGDFQISNKRKRTFVVSIRAPLRRAGRRFNISNSPVVALFQSAPRSEERGDLNRPLGVWPSDCFNPRPAPKSGATAFIGEA